MGSGLWPPTSSRLHFGKTQERISQRQTHHILCGVTFSTHAQHSCLTDLPTHSSCLSKPLCHGGCLHTPLHLEISACGCRSNLGQSGLSGLLHQHRSRQVCPFLVHASGLLTAQHERLRRRSFLRLSGKIQQPRRHHQRAHLPSSQCHPENRHKRRSEPHQISTQHADVRSWPKVHSSMQRQSNGKPSFPCLMSDGGFHQ